MSGAAQTWRVVLVDARVFPLELVWVGTLVIAKLYGLRAEGVAISGTGADVYDAVADMGRGLRGFVAEIVPPGEPTRDELRAQLAAHQGHTDAAVDGVREMLPEALKIAREDSAAAMRQRAEAVCVKHREKCLAHSEEAERDGRPRDSEEWDDMAGVANSCLADIAALPLDAPAAEGASS